LTIPEQKWERISMDFIIGLPKVQDRNCIYVVVDTLTKYAYFFSIPSEYNASQVENMFFREVFRLHGIMRNTVNDRDRKFLIAL
jgi:hypothetical protein